MPQVLRPQRDQKPGNVFLGVVHRLDRPVGGVILFAKTSKALSRLNRMVQERAFQKTYWAIVGQKPPQIAGQLTHYLGRDEARNKSYVCPSTRKDAKEARLDYRLIASGERYHLLEIQLHTGRHHQIRTQLAAIGCPIKGDLKYGFPRSNPDQSISLHARSLSLVHPVSQAPLLITAEPPADKLWQCLQAQVQA